MVLSSTESNAEQYLMKYQDEKLEDFAVADEFARRATMVMRKKNLGIEKLSNQLGGFWYIPCFDEKRHPDGSYDSIPLNRLKLFVEGRLFVLPKRSELDRLEQALNQAVGTVFPHFYDNDFTKTDFLMACGYYDDDSNRTKKFWKSPSVKNYVDMVKQKREQEKKDREDYLAQQEKVNKEKQRQKLDMLKKRARVETFEEEGIT